MSYLLEQSSRHDEVEKIIQQVFQISGVKLTADDPIVAVLVLQERNLSSTCLLLQEETQKLMDAVAEIKKYREQVLVELMGEAKHASDQIEEQIVGILGKRLSEFQRLQNHKNLVINKISLCLVGLMGMVFGILLFSFFI